MSVKISDELLREAREEAKATDRSITSQIEHWVRLGRKAERSLRHDEVVAVKRAADDDPLLQSLLAKIRRVADSDHSDLAKELLASGPVYQSAPGGGIERIMPDGTRSIGHIVGRQFVPDEPKAKTRRR